MAALTPAQNAFLGALDFEPRESKANGALGKVHKFGHEWIEPRERFIVSAKESQIGVIHSFAMAIFHTAWSMTAGKFFVDKEPRTFAIQSWKDLGNNLVTLFKSVLGIISPKAADWTDKHLLSVRPKNEQEEPKLRTSQDEILEGSQSDDDEESSSSVDDTQK